MNSARQAAALCVHAVCEQGESLDAALAVHSTPLSGSDLSLCRALSYGGVRWYLAYKQVLKERLKKPFKPKDRILYAVLITALYQLDDTQHAPHAIVNEAVTLTKTFNRQWAGGVVNAVLRAYIRESESRSHRNSAQWNVQAYPGWMVKAFREAWPNHVDAILEASQRQPPMTLRVNVRKNTPEEYLALLTERNITASRCLDCQTGISLDHPVPAENLPGFDTAQVSVQDESAQLAAEALDLLPGQRVLDACAAPGGKSLHILEREPGIESLAALDLPDRLPRLRENFKRAHAGGNIIEGDLRQADRWWDGAGYDRILLDVPCTGTGVIRRHPDIKFRRQAENGLQFATQQGELLRHAWRLLKPGGKLLYTTCSILPAENERCIAAFARETSSAAAMDLPAIGLKTDHGRQRLPGVHSGDGFFYALLEKGLP